MLQLYHRHSPGLKSAARQGTVLFVHGKGVHSGRYEKVVAAINQAGFDCLTYDQRGHGLSEGARLYVGSFDDYCDDLQRMCRLLVTLPKPHFLMAHSMGALVSWLFLAKNPKAFAAATLLSLPVFPAVHPSPFKRLLVSAIARLAPYRLFATGIAPEKVMKNQQEIRNRKTDPLVTFKVTAPWFFAFENAQGQVLKDTPTLTMPLLLIHGGKDAVAPVAGSEVAIKRCIHPQSRLWTLPEAWHELLLDPEGEEILAESLSFFRLHHSLTPT